MPCDRPIVGRIVAAPLVLLVLEIVVGGAGLEAGGARGRPSTIRPGVAVAPILILPTPCEVGREESDPVEPRESIDEPS